LDSLSIEEREGFTAPRAARFDVKDRKCLIVHDLFST